MIIVICAIGAYTVHNSMFDVWLMLRLRRSWATSSRSSTTRWRPLVLALVLGDRAEDSFRQSMLASQGDMRIFFSNGLVGTITTLALLLLFWPLISKGLEHHARAQGARLLLGEAHAGRSR